MNQKKSLGCLDLVSEVIQKIIEDWPLITKREIKEWIDIHRDQTLQPEETDLGELSESLKKLLLILYTDYDDIIEKGKRGKIFSAEDRRKYQMALLSWEIFWRQAKIEILKIPPNAKADELFFYQGFRLAIKRRIAQNIVPFPGINSHE